MGVEFTMIYLNSFHMPSQEEDEGFFSSGDIKTRQNCYASQYPFVMFRERGLPNNFEFKDITIFCGNNGSGKSTILNVIAETLKLERKSPFNRSDFFDDYVDFCEYEVNRRIPPHSSVITSDDVFERVLDIRRINNGIDDKRAILIDEWIDNNSLGADTTLHGIDDYERWKKVMVSRRISQSQHLRSNLMRNVTERSNGESALSLFVDAIQDNALYLLDEPENSLSPSNQLELKYFLEDCVKNHGCQFIISTHSPFLLALQGAKIYDIESVPMQIRKWTDLECVKVYQQFFEEKSFLFHL